MKDEDELSLEDKDAYFVSYREVKIDNKRVKIYLTKGGVSKHTEVLAVVGEESGTSVKYRNAANFTNHGKLKTDSKKVLLEWLDGIVAEGIARSSTLMDVDPTLDPAVGETGKRTGQVQQSNTPTSSNTLYANHSSEKFVFPDGRRGIRFYLIDSNGHQIPAVIGEERDTRDGHYVYQKDREFNQGPPLSAGNLIGVNRWLREMCVPGSGVGLGVSFGSHPPKKGGSGGGGGGKAGGGNANNPPGGIDPLGYFDAKRKRASFYFASDHTGDDLEPPTDVVFLAQREVRWTDARTSALAYVRSPMDSKEKTEFDKITSELASLTNFESSSDLRKLSKKQKIAAGNSNTAKLIKALRGLQGLYVSLAVLETSAIRETVTRLKTHSDETVKNLATQLGNQWLCDLRAHVATLSATYDRPVIKLGSSAAAGNYSKQHSKKPPKAKKNMFTDAFIASRRNEPELRRTRETREDVMKREIAERQQRERAQKEQRDVAAKRAREKRLANDLNQGRVGVHTGALPAHTNTGSMCKTGNSMGVQSDAVSSQKHTVDAFPGGFPGTPLGSGSLSSKTDSSGRKEKYGNANANTAGTPLGKGRKLCNGCAAVVGSPTRVCPHCQTTLPMKETKVERNTPVGDTKHTAAGVSLMVDRAAGGGAGSGAGTSQVHSANLLIGDTSKPSDSVAHYLSRHQVRFTSCKVSQLKRNVADVVGGMKAILDSGRVTDPSAAKNLRENMKKMQEVKLLQGVVERPKARREVVAFLDAAIKMCQTYGV